MIKLATLIKDPQDPADYIYEFDLTDILPQSVDLREFTSFIENQYSVGSCTGQAMVGAAEMFLTANGVFKDTEATDPQDLSRLFNYFTSRSYFPKEFQDNDLGSIARCALKAAKNFGICSEQTHPYDVAGWNKVPSQEAYEQAKNYRLGAYYRIPLLVYPTLQGFPSGHAVKHALATGYPVMVGMLVGDKIRTLKPGDDYPYITPLNNPQIGGHEMLIVGYTPTHFIVRNSWGKEWCDNGYFNIRQEVLINDVMDLWVVKGFGGFEKVGDDQTKKYVPAPEPVKPDPIPEPAPVPVPVIVIDPPKPEEKKTKTGVIVGAVLAITAAALTWYVFGQSTI